MEIQSDTFRLVPVTYIDVGYLGSIRSLTLRTDEGDSYCLTPERDIEVTLRSDKQDEDVVLYRRHIQWQSIRRATLKWPLKGNPVEEALKRQKAQSLVKQGTESPAYPLGSK